MEANTTLLESSAFRWTVRVFGYAALLYAGIVIINFEPQGSAPLSPAYLNSLIAELKNPALIAGVSLPILGLIASHLRSIQTKKQIETQQDQNTFSNYSKHREFFTQLFKDEGLFGDKSGFWGDESGLAGKAHELHALLYPNAQTGSLYASSEKITEFESLIASAKTVCESSLKVTWKSLGTPHELTTKVDHHLKLLQRSFNLQGRFFQESHELSSIATKLNCLAVTHKDLMAASTFITINECSKQFEKMHDLVSEALEHLREMTREQHLLDQLVELAEMRESQRQPMSGHLKSGLTDFLSSDTEAKLAFIEKKLGIYSSSQDTIQQVKELAENAATNSGGQISQHLLDDPASSGHTSLS